MKTIFDLEESTAVRVLVGTAITLILWGFFAPLIQFRQASGFVTGAQSLVFSPSLFDKLGALILFAVCIGSAVCAALERYEYLGRLAYVAFLITFSLFLLHIIGFLFDGRFSLTLFVPAWVYWSSHLAFGYGWTILILASGLLCFAAYTAGAAPELVAMQSRIEAAAAPAMQRHSTQQKAKRNYNGEFASAPLEVHLFWKIVAGYLIFSFCLSMAPLGFFLWKFLDEEDSPHTIVALCGWVLGALFFFGFVAFQVIGAMSKVGVT